MNNCANLLATDMLTQSTATGGAPWWSDSAKSDLNTSSLYVCYLINRQTVLSEGRESHTHTALKTLCSKTHHES